MPCCREAPRAVILRSNDPVILRSEATKDLLSSDCINSLNSLTAEGAEDCGNSGENFFEHRQDAPASMAS